MDVYRLLRPVLFSCDPEKVHDFVLSVLNRIDPYLDSWVKELDDPSLQQEICGIEFKSPVGLAAGLDKEGVATNAWAYLNFGFAEIGTVTPFPQDGNQKPRIFRTENGLINRMGFPSSGIDQVVKNLARRTRRIPVGINIGPNKEDAADPERLGRMSINMACAAHAMNPLKDYLVINLSSPNTPGLRNSLDPKRFAEFFRSFHIATNISPVFIKISPDMADDEIREFCDCVLDLPIAGIIATNTTISDRGGISGKPLTSRALEVTKIAYERFKGKRAIIASGGIMNTADAIERIRAGADLVQIFTGMIFTGPDIARTINRELARYLNRNNIENIQEIRGEPWNDSQL